MREHAVFSREESAAGFRLFPEAAITSSTSVALEARAINALEPQNVAVVVKTNGIPFWLVGELTTTVRTYFSGWIGMFTGGKGF